MIAPEKFQRHHAYWPRKDYWEAGKLAWTFRNLPCNIRLISAALHSHIHRTQSRTTGGMPKDETMAAQIADCFTRGCTKTNCKIGREQGGRK